MFINSKLNGLVIETFESFKFKVKRKKVFFWYKKIKWNKKKKKSFRMNKNICKLKVKLKHLKIWCCYSRIIVMKRESNIELNETNESKRNKRKRKERKDDG